MFLDEFEIRLHGPMVRPLIIHEFVEFSAGIFAAKVTERLAGNLRVQRGRFIGVFDTGCYKAAAPFHGVIFFKVLASSSSATSVS